MPLQSTQKTRYLAERLSGHVTHPQGRRARIPSPQLLRNTESLPWPQNLKSSKPDPHLFGIEAYGFSCCSSFFLTFSPESPMPSHDIAQPLAVTTSLVSAFHKCQVGRESGQVVRAHLAWDDWWLDNFLSPSHTSLAPTNSTPATKPSFSLSSHRPLARAVLSSTAIPTQFCLLTFKALPLWLSQTEKTSQLPASPALTCSDKWLVLSLEWRLHGDST